MALINCPNCGKEISDKAAACPGCGYRLKETVEQICPECGAVLPDGSTACPNCGCPVGAYEAETVLSAEEGSPKKKKHVFVWVIILAMIAALGWYLYSNQVKANTYNAFVDLYNTMLDGAREAETAGNLQHDVWANSILKEKDEKTDKYTRKDDGVGAFYDDFNDALGALYKDEEFIEKARDIYAARMEAEAQMKALAKHPDSFNEQYSDFKDCYNLFIKFVDLVLEPNGSLLDYTNNFNDLDESSANKFKELSIYFE